MKYVEDSNSPPNAGNRVRVIVELAEDSRQLLQRYGALCAAAAIEEDAVRSASPMGFTL
jgi:hypothetical protein